MSIERYVDEEEARPLNQDPSTSNTARASFDSITSASTTSIVLERLNHTGQATGNGHTKIPPRTAPFRSKDEYYNEEDKAYRSKREQPTGKKARRIMWLLGGFCLGGWLLALVLFVAQQTYRHASTRPHDPSTTTSRGSGKAVTLDQVLGGQWRPRRHEISWIAGAGGEDGLLLERNGGSGTSYLVVEDVRSRKPGSNSLDSKILMKSGSFDVNGARVDPSKVWPSPDLRKVLVMSEQQSNWRHSFTGKYWIFDVASQTGEPLDPSDSNGRIQLASWSPQSDAIVFTKNNNIHLRRLSSPDIITITRDGGTELFYGVPDWVYEEEVFSGNSATWWSDNGKFLAFLRTNETTVPEYPIQYFVSRPSGHQPPPGEENYPEIKKIKYPKAGAPNPVVDIQFYDIVKNEVLSVDIDGDYPDDDRLITEVVWAGKDGRVLVRETNRESDILKLALIDVSRRTGNIVRTEDVNAIDGGWFEVSEETRFIPGDPGNGRNHDGYIDTIIHEGYDHLAYFTPLDNPEPIILTSGKWEVVKAPSAVDLNENLVYFVATKESSIQRHVYSVRLDGSNLQPITDISKEGYYDVSFSNKAGYALLSYQGPNIPWQRIISTPSITDQFEDHIEDNRALSKLASEHELPLYVYQTVMIDGYELNVVERRPPHFDEHKKYPVLFHLYGGPGSQEVTKKFSVDFESYVPSNLGYIDVTVDGRGTGFIGRKARTIIRGNLGYYEAKDQIETAKMWAKKPYVDENRIAIWGWSYGGFMALKTIEQDGGNTFQYGMAVAPVTDWRFYDSIYTERYMHTPQHNKQGYENCTISNTTSLSQNVRFLIMHGVADDNVHFQNSLTLLDRLDLAGVENYDFHAFPDSDHGIYFHNANRMVYDRLNEWLINAFNGEFHRTSNAVPLVNIDSKRSIMSETAMFSSSTKELLGKVRMMVPPMLEKFHKGQLGRVAVIGGSQDYTGAPYFSAMASARLGADLSHVICDPDAGQVIKGYSPNLMVHPWMRASDKNPFSTSASRIAEPIIDLLPRLHSLVIGPGLGRDPLMQETVACVVAEARKQNIPMILDADALLLVLANPDLVKGYRECILTPNVNEFGRLAKAMNVDTGGDQGEGCAKLAHALGGVLIVRKGGHDYISNGDKTVVSDIEGGRKRAGGQGDTLTGSMGTLLAWRTIYLEGLWDTEGNLSKDDLLMLAAFGGSCITRECSRLAFKKMGRALQASDLTEQVPVSFEHLIGEKEESKM